MSIDPNFVKFTADVVRPFLTQSDSASRKRPFSTGLFSTRCFQGLSYFRQSSRFSSFCALPRGGWCEGVLLYGSRKSVGSSVPCAFFASNACFARDKPSPKRVVGVGLS